MVPLALFVPDGPSLFTPIWILLGLLFVGVMVDLKAKLPAYGRVTPFRIYEKGISMGYGRHPYRPIEAIYSIEETVSAKHRAPFAVVAFSDGTESGISKRGLGRPMIVLTDDFERTTEMLRGLLAGASLPRLPWDSEAIAFVEGLHALRGATRARIENVAREKDVDRVTLAFIAANWREIGDSDGVRWRQFRKVARNEFGDTSVKMSPIPRGH